MVKYPVLDSSGIFDQIRATQAYQDGVEIARNKRREKVEEKKREQIERVRESELKRLEVLKAKYENSSVDFP